MENIQYACKECGAKAQVLENGTIHRECEHQDVAITADLSAHAVGIGSLQQE